jgi:hypothetical protein
MPSPINISGWELQRRPLPGAQAIANTNLAVLRSVTEMTEIKRRVSTDIDFETTCTRRQKCFTRIITNRQHSGIACKDSGQFTRYWMRKRSDTLTPPNGLACRAPGKHPREKIPEDGAEACRILQERPTAENECVSPL